MKFSGAEAAFALLLAVSLSGKLLAARTAVPEPDADALNAESSELFRDGGFAVTPERQKFGVLLRGERPGCRLLAGGYDPRGTLGERFRQLAAPVGPLRF